MPLSTATSSISTAASASASLPQRRHAVAQHAQDRAVAAAGQEHFQGRDRAGVAPLGIAGFLGVRRVGGNSCRRSGEPGVEHRAAMR
jgi:hypothetical protein